MTKYWTYDLFKDEILVFVLLEVLFLLLNMLFQFLEYE